jgi:hypothetical protein
MAMLNNQRVTGIELFLMFIVIHEWVVNGGLIEIWLFNGISTIEWDMRTTGGSFLELSKIIVDISWTWLYGTYFEYSIFL